MTDQKQRPSGPQVLPMNSEEWCVFLHTRDVNDQDRERHEAWLNSAPGNRAEYALCELSWRLSQGLADSPALAERLATSSTNRQKSTPRRTWYPAAMAASLLIGAVSLFMVVQWQSSDNFQTAVGEFRQVDLADGSVVDLNTDTEIKVALRGRERVAELLRGEAFFDVSPDPDRPFIVRTESGEVRVVGTQFNVSTLNGETLVTVIEGHVQVMTTDGERVNNGEGAREILDVMPGQQARVTAKNEVEKIEELPKKIEWLVSWRSGRIHFENETIADVLKEVNRYIENNLVVADPKVASLPVTGIFKTGDLESVTSMFEVVYGLEVKQVNDQLVLYQP